MKLVFFGTPPAALPALEKLKASQHDVTAVVTAPDRASGRGMQLSASAVKQAASRLGIPVFQPPSLKDDAAVDLLRGFEADVFVVVAYGLILPKRVLDLPQRGCINVHFSVLPRWRGAAPVQWAILEGDHSTGVSLMQMDEGLDTGPVFSTVVEPIGEDDTTGTLEQKLSVKGADALLDLLDRIDEVEPQVQNENEATNARKLTPKDSRIDWSLPPHIIVRRIRAFDPRPGAWTMLAGKRLKLWRAMAADVSTPLPDPGTVIATAPDLLVSTGGGAIALQVVQPESGSRLSAAEFVRGHRPVAGDRFE